MGRKDKIKRSNEPGKAQKAEAAAEKKVQECSKIIDKLLPTCSKWRAKAKHIEDNGLFVEHNKNRAPGELTDVVTTDDIQLGAIKEKIEEMENQLRFHCQFVANPCVAKFGKFEKEERDDDDENDAGMGEGDAMVVQSGPLSCSGELRIAWLVNAHDPTACLEIWNHCKQMASIIVKATE